MQNDNSSAADCSDISQNRGNVELSSLCIDKNVGKHQHVHVHPMAYIPIAYKTPLKQCSKERNALATRVKKTSRRLSICYSYVYFWLSTR